MYVCILIYVHIKELYIHTYVQGGKASIHTYVCKSRPRFDLKSVEYPFPHGTERSYTYVYIRMVQFKNRQSLRTSIFLMCANETANH